MNGLIEFLPVAWKLVNALELSHVPRPHAAIMAHAIKNILGRIRAERGHRICVSHRAPDHFPRFHIENSDVFVLMSSDYQVIVATKNKICLRVS
jgi:hypothetical protein